MKGVEKQRQRREKRSLFSRQQGIFLPFFFLSLSFEDYVKT